MATSITGRERISQAGNREAAELWNTTAQAAVHKLSTEQPIFFDEIGDRVSLPTVQPAGQHIQHHLERHAVDHEPELISPARLKDVGRVVEHYAFHASLVCEPRRN